MTYRCSSVAVIGFFIILLDAHLWGRPSFLTLSVDVPAPTAAIPGIATTLSMEYVLASCPSVTFKFEGR